ncbi:AN1-like Zinc finger containing protein, putative [Angomonas deanei]|uniref:AN1-like Zinc finger containing protein, putative n=1 Tax=Angomonas deanei TaxID=59799 RepID=A0A7G2CGG8_9TRYP|nr:AN1-like Zinc finger containing protein, putative [Angomonas deanei]
MEPCCAPSCSNMAYMALPKCEYCDKRFCAQHLLPEVHGCGDACKNESHRQATADAIAQRKSRKHIGLDEEKKKLDKNIQESQKQRQKKKKK